MDKLRPIDKVVEGRVGKKIIDEFRAASGIRLKRGPIRLGRRRMTPPPARCIAD